MPNEYLIGERCVGCGGCHSVCPAKCIEASVRPLRIDAQRCTGCGFCAAACPIGAIAPQYEKESQ